MQWLRANLWGGKQRRRRRACHRESQQMQAGSYKHKTEIATLSCAAIATNKNELRNFIFFLTSIWNLTNLRIMRFCCKEKINTKLMKANHTSICQAAMHWPHWHMSLTADTFCACSVCVFVACVIFPLSFAVLLLLL